LSDIDFLLEEVRRLGGKFHLREDGVKVEYPEEVREDMRPILDKLRQKRDEVCKLLYKQASGIPAPPGCPPIPAGVRLKKYAPKPGPVLIAPWSLVAHPDQFIAACFRDLDWRLKHPKSYAAPPIPQILAKLAEVGVEVELEAGGLAAGKTRERGWDEGRLKQ